MACCKKIYVLPKFNLVCNIVTGHIGGPAIPPDVARVISPCALQFGAFIAAINYPLNAPIKEMYLMLPALTDIRSPMNALMPDYVEVPAGTGRWYIVNFVDDVWKGYPTEYRVALMLQTFPAGGPFWPVPIP